MFLFDLTHHSWEPNLVEKTKFRIFLPDMKSERFVYEICLKCAVLVFRCCTSEAAVHMAQLRNQISEKVEQNAESVDRSSSTKVRVAAPSIQRKVAQPSNCSTHLKACLGFHLNVGVDSKYNPERSLHHHPCTCSSSLCKIMKWDGWVFRLCPWEGSLRQ